jgi:hypothetical protein
LPLPFPNPHHRSALHALFVGKFDALWSHADESQEQQKLSKKEEHKAAPKAGKKKK